MLLYLLPQCAENKELQEKIYLLQQQLASTSGDKSSLSEQCASEEYVEELRRKILSQVITGSWILNGHGIRVLRSSTLLQFD